MKTTSSASLIRTLLAISVGASLAVLTGCGPNVAGTYVGTPGNSVFDKIDLQSDGKVVITLVGIDYDATYEVNGSKVVVNNQGQLHELTIDDNGCLVDGIGGTYCQDGRAPGTASAAGPKSSPVPVGAMSGTYEAKEPGGATMAIEFLNGNGFRVRMGLPGAMSGMAGAMPGTYVVQGDHILLTVTGDTEVLDLTRKGNTLVGTIDGDKLTFTKK